MADENSVDLTPGLTKIYGDTSGNEPTTENTPVSQSVGSGLPEIDYSVQNLGDTSKKSDSSNIDLSDIGLGAGSYLLGKKFLNPNSILSSDVMNTALNLAKTNNDLGMAMDIHKTNIDKLTQAQQNHDYWHSEDAINDHLSDEFKSKPPIVEPPSLTVLPEGGEGSSNYAKKFLPSSIANTATSMQDVQQRLIPQNDLQAVATQRLAPGTVLSEESPLALDPAAQQAKIEQLIAENAKADAVVKARAAVQSKIAPIQTSAVDLVKAAQDNASKSQKVLDDLASKQAQQRATLTSTTSSMNPNLTAEAERMAETGQGGLSTIIKGGANILRKGFAGLNFAAIPYETRQAISSGKAGDWTGALTHGASALGSAAQLAPEVAALTGIGVEAAPAIALGGGALGLGILGKNIYDQYPEIKNFVSNKLK